MDKPHAQFPDEQSDDGRFVRQDDAFRGWVSADGRTGFPAVAGRYHLYVSLACPWAHRTIIMRKLKGLETAIGMTVVDPIRDDRGWRYGTHFLSELYYATDPQYRGRVTVPVLWDPQTRRIVSNSDDDILRMFETEFEALATPGPDYYPQELRPQIDALNEEIFRDINDGVYQAGFATSQSAYEDAAYRVFAALDRLEERLSSRRYLFGAAPVETDWRFFVTLIRFDPVYVGHFKCNLRRIVDYPNLYGYLRDLYQYPGVAQTVDFDHIKRHYYMTHDDINPTRIVPIGPLQFLQTPHGREGLSGGA
jgi:glutathionyl-hydroquinone reductase